MTQVNYTYKSNPEYTYENIQHGYDSAAAERTGSLASTKWYELNLWSRQW